MLFWIKTYWLPSKIGKELQYTIKLPNTNSALLTSPKTLICRSCTSWSLWKHLKTKICLSLIKLLKNLVLWKEWKTKSTSVTKQKRAYYCMNKTSSKLKLRRWKMKKNDKSSSWLTNLNMKPKSKWIKNCRRILHFSVK